MKSTVCTNVTKCKGVLTSADYKRDDRYDTWKPGNLKLGVLSSFTMKSICKYISFRDLKFQIKILQILF